MITEKPLPRAVDRAVNATMEVLALKQAVQDDGKERTSPIMYAQARKVEAFRALNGGQLGQVRRILGEKGIKV